MIRTRMIGWASLSLLLAGLAATAGAAHEPADGKRQKQKIIIMSERSDPAGKGHAGMEHRGPHMMIADCAGQKSEFSGESRKGDGDKVEKAKVVICTRGDASTADRARRLERALARINANDELSSETKAKISTALREAIAQLNTAR